MGVPPVAEGDRGSARLSRLAIVGTGLIGASVGLAAKRAGVEMVAGFDPAPEALRVARERGAIDLAATSPVEAVAGSQLVIVATPVADLPGRVREALELADSTCTVTDVGSTKSAVCAAAGGDDRFIGGHPVCGSETSGPEHASAALFEGATWFLTPQAGTDPECYRVVHGFVAALGAHPVAIDAAAHDRLVALTSHLPHALSNLLVNQAGETRIEGHEPLASAGGSLRDMTRVAGANPSIWIDIFLENADPLREALAEHRRMIEQLESALASGDAGFVGEWIVEAGQHRRHLLAEVYPSKGGLYRLRVHVVDQPGVLASITEALGAERINIEDLEMQHVSPDRGGSLSIVIAGEDEARRAAELLAGQGYGVVVSDILEEDI
ncbi:MAG: prephenate dehydrogenase/arogenate dehydrogenase family protein [Gaiellaceae bacterium]|jgi:prephenate dehydrogenase